MHLYGGESRNEAGRAARCRYVVRMHRAGVFAQTGAPRGIDPYRRDLRSCEPAGRFSKELAVYASDKRKIATLTIGGTVIPRPKSIEELYPVDAGGGVRLSTTLSSFSYLYVGKEVHAAVEYVNTSKHAVEFRLRPKETSGCLRIGAPNASKRVNGGVSIWPM